MSLFAYAYLAEDAAFVSRRYFFVLLTLNLWCFVFFEYSICVLVELCSFLFVLCAWLFLTFPTGALPYGVQPPRRSDAGIQGAEPPILTA